MKRKCAICQRKVIASNMILWDGKLYGKGCFNKHIKTVLLAEKLKGEEFYKLLKKAVIESIANLEIKNNNYFTKSIQDQAKIGYLTDRQIITFAENLTFKERLSIIENVIDITVNADTVKNKDIIESTIYKIIGAHVLSKFEKEQLKQTKKEMRKQFKKEKQQEALSMINDLYVSNSNFKLFIDSNYDGLNEFCLDELESSLFNLIERELKEKIILKRA